MPCEVDTCALRAFVPSSSRLLCLERLNLRENLVRNVSECCCAPAGYNILRPEKANTCPCWKHVVPALRFSWVLLARSEGSQRTCICQLVATNLQYPPRCKLQREVETAPSLNRFPNPAYNSRRSHGAGPCLRHGGAGRSQSAGADPAALRGGARPAAKGRRHKRRACRRSVSRFIYVADPDFHSKSPIKMR